MRPATNLRLAAVSAALTLSMAAGLAHADPPAFDKVASGLTEVNSDPSGNAPYYELHKEDKTGRLLAVLPSGFDKQTVMIACTISGGDPQAGVMGPTLYAQWQRVNDTLMLVEPNLAVRTEGDQQAKDSVDQLYTGRMLLKTPIVAMKGNRPVIDLGNIATTQAGRIFGPAVFGGYGPTFYAVDPSVARLTKTKAFPENVIFEYEAPRQDGVLVRFTYNISKLEGTSGYKPRKADPRVGYFYSWYQDFAKPANEMVTDRFISRWNVEKADPSLKMSPPKEPIVWYIEHTTPVRYRRYVREGIELWNAAFREIGIDGALEVRQQDSSTGAFMDVDPEDARYNFFRWNTSDQGYAIGPSRTNPYTGEILDADVVWHQGLTRSIRSGFESLGNDIADQAFDAKTLEWFEANPTWDPRVRLAEVGLATAPNAAGDQATGDGRGMHAEPTPDAMRTGIAAHLCGPTACHMGSMLSLDFALADAALMTGALEVDSEESLLDGLPEAFVGQMIRYISAHEVGHCLGLQHNMTASTIRSLEEINTEGFTGPTIGSVMEYAGVNINHELGEVQGPYATPELGPYDHWVIAYGYGPEGELDDVLSRVSEPDNVWVPQVAMMAGNDPRNVTWDLGKDNLQFAESRLSLVKELRGKLIDEIVDDGESWAVARRRYNALLGTHLQSCMIAANYVGGSYSNNDFKGDPGDRAPVEDVPAETQRRALNIIIDNTFHEDAYGLTPDLLRHLGKEHWWDPAGMSELQADPAVTVHNLVGAIQATALSFVMNPTTLRRVYDNEYRTGEDAFTMSELVTSVTDSAWTEYASLNGSSHDLDVSSFRRNLQHEQLGRLITLALMDTQTSPSLRTISTLARQELRRVDKMIDKAQGRNANTYTAAHLAESRERIKRALEASYVLPR